MNMLIIQSLKNKLSDREKVRITKGKVVMLKETNFLFGRK